MNPVLPVQTVVIDDASAARLHKLLLIATIASNFPIFIIGLGGLLVIILLILVIRLHKKKVSDWILQGHLRENSARWTWK